MPDAQTVTASDRIDAVVDADDAAVEQQQEYEQVEEQGTEWPSPDTIVDEHDSIGHNLDERGWEGNAHRMNRVASSLSNVNVGTTQVIWDDRYLISRPQFFGMNPLRHEGMRPGATTTAAWRAHQDRLRRHIGTPETEMVAVRCRNGIIVDPRFDPDGMVTTAEVPVMWAPIDVLNDTVSDPANLRLVDQDREQTLFRDEADGWDRYDYYLRGEGEGFDVTDGWIAHLEEPALSIEHALSEHMRPNAVQAAEEQGLVVRRQGDWFFVEQHDEYMPTAITRTPELQPDGECQFLQNHLAEWLGHDALNPDRTLVKGAVHHRTDDHSTMSLGDQWYEAVHNGVESVSFECEAFDGHQQQDYFVHDEFPGPGF